MERQSLIRHHSLLSLPSSLPPSLASPPLSPLPPPHLPSLLSQVFAYVGKWSVEEPTVYPGITGDKALVLKTKAAQHAISAPFDEVLDPKGKPLVLSYEIKLQKSLDCGGAYAKLLTESPEGIQAEEFYDKTPYTMLFGPDRCGATSKVHFIFRHRDPLTGVYEEKHLINPPQPKINRLTSLYTLIVRPEDQTYEILINNDSVRKGSLLEDFSPAVNPRPRSTTRPIPSQYSLMLLFRLCILRTAVPLTAGRGVVLMTI